MSNTQTWMATPSVSLPTGRVLGMPACAQVDSRVLTGVATVRGKTAGRDRIATLTGRAAVTVDAFPGDPAWRPPLS